MEHNDETIKYIHKQLLEIAKKSNLLIEIITPRKDFKQ